MRIQDYLQHFSGDLHNDYEALLSDLKDEQAYFLPTPGGNHIAFTIWHWVRTEDNVVQFVLQRQPTVWVDKGLDTAWNLHKAAQGTGMPVAEAQALRIPSPAAMLDYAKSVWASTDRYLANVSDDELARVVKMNPFGELPVLQALGRTLIAHGNQHLGEIWVIRELQGMPGGSRL